ncbi:MAG: DUF72 domain-containing protein [Acidimicrobiales bacterium]
MVDDMGGRLHVPDDGRSPQPLAEVHVGESRVLFGTSSWADRSLVNAGTFYPKRTMTARARLAFYAGRFPLAEVATTYRFPPTPDLARQWAERTTPGFTLDIRAWSLLTGSPTLPDSLWPDLQDEVRDRARDHRRLYAAHLSEGAMEECWARFEHSLRPLHDAGKLGAVILQYPGWFSPRPEAWGELALAAARLPDYAKAVELRSPKWVDGPACDATLEWLEEHGLAFVCTDAASTPRVAAATSDVAVVRFRGRRQVAGEPWASPYRYSRGELAEWAPPLVAMASSARSVHVVMDNCWGSDAVDNASDLAGLLRDIAA